MPENSGQVPSTIVSLMLDKISSFTKELEVLRAQLPSKEDFSTLNTKIDKFLTSARTLFAVAMIIVVLSFLGAKIIDYIGQENRIEERSDTTYTKEEMDHKFDELLDQINTLHEKEAPKGG